MKVILLAVILTLSIRNSFAQVIVIDAGHGYRRAADGTILNPDTRTDLEIRTNLAVAKKLRKIVSDSTKWVVHMTRECDTCYMSTSQRALFSNEKKPDVFLSVHCNAGGGTGTESFWCDRDNVNSVNNELLAKAINTTLTSICVCTSRRVCEDFTYMKGSGGNPFHLDVLKRSKAPSCLNEMGFVDHNVDKVRLESDEWRSLYAMAYYKALKTYIKDRK